MRGASLSADQMAKTSRTLHTQTHRRELGAASLSRRSAGLGDRSEHRGFYKMSPCSSAVEIFFVYLAQHSLHSRGRNIRFGMLLSKTVARRQSEDKYPLQSQGGTDSVLYF